ncbi:MAG: M67 family metallopeptidase [Ardenticatenaceae bacterium]|nr:M67 family metallopeptidase [Ardenticatenaceae bacterium]
MLRINQPVYEAMLAHLQAVYPLEGCGLLGGVGDTAVRHTAVDNILRSPVAYEMDPTQQIRAMLELEAQGQEMLAIYHSHPAGPPHPSPTDVAQAYYPDAVYLIISLADRAQPVVGAFRIGNGRYTPIPLAIE